MSFGQPAREGISSQDSRPRLETTQPISPSAIGLSPPMDFLSENSSMGEHFPNHQTAEGSSGQNRGGITIDILPDDVLLGIFDYNVRNMGWKTLVHVCRRWRVIVFGSPHRLGLRLICTAGTPVRKMLDIWPAFPIAIRVDNLEDEGVDNVIAALERNDRVCAISVGIATFHTSEMLAEAMKNPFPVLTHLNLWTCGEVGSSFSRPASVSSPFVPDSFLGGSTPRLRSLRLVDIGLLALPKLLWSANDIVRLRLEESCFDNFPSQAMVEFLPLMTRLEILKLNFEGGGPVLDREDRHPLPITRTVLSMFTTLIFKGEYEYLNHLFAHIDAPLLKVVNINLLDWASFDVSQISPFIGRTETFETFDQAYMQFEKKSPHCIRIALSSRSGTNGCKALVMSFTCVGSRWYINRLIHHPIAHSGDLKLSDAYGCSPLYWIALMKNADWLTFLRHFSAVEGLYLSLNLAAYVVPALEKLDKEREMEVLPALQNLFIENLRISRPVQTYIGRFTSKREISGHPIDVQHWYNA